MHTWQGEAVLHVELLPHVVPPVGSQHMSQVPHELLELVPDEAPFLVDAAVEGDALGICDQPLLQPSVRLCSHNFGSQRQAQQARLLGLLQLRHAALDSTHLVRLRYAVPEPPCCSRVWIVTSNAPLSGSN